MPFHFKVTVLLAMASQALGQSMPRTFDVYLSDRDESSVLMSPGTSLASGIFARIGVRLKWHTGEPPADPGAVGIRMLEHAAQSVSGDLLASSELNGSSPAVITMYRDEVRRFLAGHPTLHRTATGYVLAHELAHVMQGIARHSDSGIMKPHWSPHDFKEMFYRRLAFTDADVELIHSGLALRLPDRRSRIVVCTNSNDTVGPIELMSAQTLTSRTFASAGGVVEWHSAQTAPCRDDRQTGVIMIDFTAKTLAREHPGALAYAQIYEAAHIVVMYDRIERNAGVLSRVANLLANVLTHEITHLLQGVARHSGLA